MGIIRRKEATEIETHSFSGPMADPPPVETWRVMSDSDTPPALAEPEVATPALPNENAAPPESAAAASSEPAPSPQPAPVSADPPVFEVPGEILQGFYEQAVMSGIEDGKGQVMAELTVLQERYAAAIDQLVGVSKELAAHNQVQLVSLACKIAEKVIRKHLSVRPDDLLSMVNTALTESRPSDEATIYCSEPDHEYLITRRDELAAGTDGSFSLKIVADPTFEYGDFRIETTLGSTDGRVTSRVHDIQRALGGEGGDV